MRLCCSLTGTLTVVKILCWTESLKPKSLSFLEKKSKHLDVSLKQIPTFVPVHRLISYPYLRLYYDWCFLTMYMYLCFLTTDLVIFYSLGYFHLRTTFLCFMLSTTTTITCKFWLSNSKKLFSLSRTWLSFQTVVFVLSSWSDINFNCF